MNQEMLLGQQTLYVSEYDASLLCPIPRAESRQTLVKGKLPFSGEDRWTAYELSWLDQQGKPQCRIGEFFFDCSSPNIIESKSFKLYLNSFNQTRFASEEKVVECLKQDLSAAAGQECRLHLLSLSSFTELITVVNLPGTCIDGLALEVEHYSPRPQLLQVSEEQRVDSETLYSHLLKTNCPVTDQPDWATLFISYSGKKIDPKSLLAYIVSFREHQDFHENCVERIFCELNEYCQPDCLTVYARYTRRGGLDINPLRSNGGINPFISHPYRACRQ